MQTFWFSPLVNEIQKHIESKGFEEFTADLITEKFVSIPQNSYFVSGGAPTESPQFFDELRQFFKKNEDGTYATLSFYPGEQPNYEASTELIVNLDANIAYQPLVRLLSYLQDLPFDPTYASKPTVGIRQFDGFKNEWFLRHPEDAQYNDRVLENVVLSIDSYLIPWCESNSKKKIVLDELKMGNDPAAILAYCFDGESAKAKALLDKLWAEKIEKFRRVSSDPMKLMKDTDHRDKQLIPMDVLSEVFVERLNQLINKVDLSA